VTRLPDPACSLVCGYRDRPGWKAGDNHGPCRNSAGGTLDTGTTESKEHRVPTSWRTGAERLAYRRAPPRVLLHRWRRFVDDCPRFMPSPWAARAAPLDGMLALSSFVPVMGAVAFCGPSPAVRSLSCTGPGPSWKVRLAGRDVLSTADRRPLRNWTCLGGSDDRNALPLLNAESGELMSLKICISLGCDLAFRTVVERPTILSAGR
jgi:hypothetical protein